MEINIPKSVLTPVQLLIFLGFQLNLQAGTVGVPKEKISSTVSELAYCSKHPLLQKRRLASILGRVRALLFAIPQLRIFTDKLAHFLKIHSLSHWNATIQWEPWDQP